MFQTMYAQQHRAATAARRDAAASCCACTASANEMTFILDAAIVASIFIVCLLSRITLSVLLAAVLVRLPLRSCVTAFPLQSPCPDAACSAHPKATKRLRLSEAESLL